MNEQEQQLLEQWQKQIAVIQKDVTDLLYSRQQIIDFEGLIKQSDFAKNNIGIFWEHYKLNYLFFAVSKVFQQIDQNQNSASLINLLKSLVYGNKTVTQEWWTKGNSIFAEQFVANFGKDGFLDHYIVISDINTLEENTKDIKKLRHKRIAHKDKNDKISSQITSETLNKAIDTLDALTRKYIMLLTGSGYDSLITQNDSWKTTFTQPWISK